MVFLLFIYFSHLKYLSISFIVFIHKKSLLSSVIFNCWYFVFLKNIRFAIYCITSILKCSLFFSVVLFQDLGNVLISSVKFSVTYFSFFLLFFFLVGKSSVLAIRESVSHDDSVSPLFACVIP